MVVKECPSRAPHPDSPRVENCDGPSVACLSEPSETRPYMPTVKRRMIAECPDPYLAPLQNDAEVEELLLGMFPRLRKMSQRRIKGTGGRGRSSLASSSRPWRKKHDKIANRGMPDTTAKKVDLACIDIHEYLMNKDEADKTLRKIKYKKKDPKRLSMGVEEYEFLRLRGVASPLRDASDLADEFGNLSIGYWSIVWDSRDGASFYLPDVKGRRFSDMDSVESLPIRIPRFRAIEILDDWWSRTLRERAGSLRALGASVFSGFSVLAFPFAGSGLSAPGGLFGGLEC